MTATFDRLIADVDATDFRDVGYSAIYTRESWESLLAAVAALTPLSDADRAALREGGDEAQMDLVAYERDMEAVEASRDRQAEMDQQFGGHGALPW